MTIQQAIEQYQSYGNKVASPALREIINRLINANVKTEFENDSYLDALVLTDVMFHRSTRSIRLLTGPGVDQFLGVLANSFKSAVERLQKSGGVVRILILGEHVPAWLSATATQFSKTLAVSCARAATPLRHFIVCDTKMLRQEEVHGPISRESDATEIKARVSFNEPGKAEVLEGYFDSMWETVGSNANS